MGGGPLAQAEGEGGGAVKLEFVGGPLCGQQRQVDALPAECDADYRPGDAPVYRYNFAGQQRVTAAHSE